MGVAYVAVAVLVRFKRNRRETAGLLCAESATEPANQSSEMKESSTKVSKQESTAKEFFWYIHALYYIYPTTNPITLPLAAHECTHCH